MTVVVGRALGWMDPATNASDGPRISAAFGRVPVWVIPTNEELMIARHTREAIAAPKR